MIQNVYCYFHKLYKWESANNCFSRYMLQCYCHMRKIPCLTSGSSPVVHSSFLKVINHSFTAGNIQENMKHCHKCPVLRLPMKRVSGPQSVVRELRKVQGYSQATARLFQLASKIHVTSQQSCCSVLHTVSAIIFCYFYYYGE
jgi:hypothetical protein